MKAMVMAAGAGTRLRPLTHAVPKPMVPIANRPVLEYTINNLRAHGITDLVLNLHSHPEMIRNYFKDGSKWGVHIEYSHEPELLGTAGGVKHVAPFLKDGTFLVMSGDGLTDINLTQLIAFHRKNRSLGSLALKPVDTRFDYGVTFTGKAGRITRFVEKPKWGDVFSNLVNTGIYVFEPSVLSQIPTGKGYDFGHQLWPKLLKNKERIFGQTIKAYWCDVGSISEYRRAQKDVLDGQVKIPMSGKKIQSNVWVGEGTVIEPGVKIEGPCLIGKNGHIAAGSHIGPYMVIGDNAHIGRDNILKYSTLWNNVNLDDHVHLEGCILGHDVHMPSHISVNDGILMGKTIQEN